LRAGTSSPFSGSSVILVFAIRPFPFGGFVIVLFTDRRHFLLRIVSFDFRFRSGFFVFGVDFPFVTFVGFLSKACLNK
jgi:hypothetical protein